MVYIQLTLITLIVVYVIDISGFTDSWTSAVSRLLTHGKKNEPFTLKPFTCSLCMSLWACLLWLIVTGGVTLFGVAYCFLMSYVSPVFHDILINLLDALTFLNNLISNIFQKGYNNG